MRFVVEIYNGNPSGQDEELIGYGICLDTGEPGDFVMEAKVYGTRSQAHAALKAREVSR